MSADPFTPTEKLFEELRREAPHLFDEETDCVAYVMRGAVVSAFRATEPGDLEAAKEDAVRFLGGDMHISTPLAQRCMDEIFEHLDEEIIAGIEAIRELPKIHPRSGSREPVVDRTEETRKRLKEMQR